MSNDQSPPARKIVPYKKGGRRQSPFAEMAFQFSGTALDVAIQQRQQEALLPPSLVDEKPRIETRDYETDPGTHSAPAQPEVTHSVPTTEEKQSDFLTNRKEPDKNLTLLQRGISKGSVRLVPASKNVDSADLTPNLHAFVDRWKPFLTETQLGICVYIYTNSAAVGVEYCFTSNLKLMSAVSKTERQIKTVLNQLIKWEFLSKGETLTNVPREQRGTFYKLNFSKS